LDRELELILSFSLTSPSMNFSKIVIGTSVLVLALVAGFASRETQTVLRLRALVPLNKITSIEAGLTKAENESCDLQEKLEKNHTETARFLERIEEVEARLTAIADSSKGSSALLESKLNEAMKMLDIAEREKALLSHSFEASGKPAAVDTGKKKPPLGGGEPGIHGTVLAVNRAYNFVVLNLGGWRGVEANSEMLVFRDRTLIGKIRISSVEPATAIGDIISSSLARGVEVQIGDTVIYAGTN
jgi:hypothetical protein